jgi:hypothetical protein
MGRKKTMSDEVNKRFSKQDYDIVLRWVETGNNKDKIDGVEKQQPPKEGEKPVVKQLGYKELSAYFNAHQRKGNVRPPMTSLSMKSRWVYLVSKYKKVTLDNLKPEYGVTDADREKGVKSIEEKNESLCHHFYRIKRLYSDDPNVVPYARLQSGTPDGAQCSFSHQGSEEHIDLDGPDTLEDGANQQNPTLRGEDPIAESGEEWLYGALPAPEPGRAEAENQAPPLEAPPQETGKRKRVKTHSYPDGPEISDTRPSIDASLVAYLEAYNKVSEKSGKSKHADEEMKLAWEKEKYQRECAERLEAREEARVEREKDREHALRLQKDNQRFQLAMACVSSSRTIEEIQNIMKLLNSNP